MPNLFYEANIDTKTKQRYQKRKVEKEENLYGSEDWKRWLGFKIQGYKSSALLLSRSVMSSSFVTPGTAARQPPLSTGIPRQEYWSGLSFWSLRKSQN